MNLPTDPEYWKRLAESEPDDACVEAGRLHPEAPKVEIGQRVYFASNPNGGGKSWVWEMMRARMAEGEVRLPSGRELIDDFRFISYDEASNITDEQIERLKHWAHRNILSPEERERIYGEERWPLTWGMDLASGPDQTVEMMVTPQKVTFAPIEDMLALQQMVHDEFYRDLFRQMAKRTMRDEDGTRADDEG